MSALTLTRLSEKSRTKKNVSKDEFVGENNKSKLSDYQRATIQKVDVYSFYVFKVKKEKNRNITTYVICGTNVGNPCV